MWLQVGNEKKSTVGIKGLCINKFNDLINYQIYFAIYIYSIVLACSRQSLSVSKANETTKVNADDKFYHILFAGFCI